MKRKSTNGKADGGERESPSEVARRAGVSRQLASRKMRQGKSGRVIVMEAARRREREAARGVNGSGHKIPSYGESQSRKEYFLAALREIELKRKSGDLVPADLLMRYFGEAIGYLRNMISRWPAQFGQEFGPRAGSRMEAELKRTFAETHRFLRLRAAELGLPDPGPLPTPTPRSRLAYYEAYSSDGEVEVIEAQQRIGTTAWHTAHPGVDAQQACRLLAKKRAWDGDMSRLLARRGDWDLDFNADEAGPSEAEEVPPPPPPRPAEDT